MLGRPVPLVLLFVASCLFRLPAFLNAAAVDSDAAIVGIQAIHILRGEWSPFLFGSGYQTSVDSFVAAGFFAVLGATPLALMLSTFVGHLALTALVFATLRRHTGRWLAATLVLPLVVTPSPLHTYILGPPRQAALTLVFLSVWLLDGAARRPLRSGLVHYAFGAAVALFACFADPYALLFLPALALLALLATADGVTGGLIASPLVRRRVLCGVIGGALGSLPLFFLWTRPGSWHGELGLTREAFARNWSLFTGECFPWIVSATAYRSRGHGLAYGPWAAPVAVRALQLAGAVVLIAGIGSGLFAVFARRIPWELRRLGLVGALVLPLTIGGFLVSVMVMDLFSTRYLAAIVLACPLALAPAGYVLRERRALLALVPYLASAALAGWLGFGPFVHGPWPVRTPSGLAKDERALYAELSERGVTSALADYWVSYRLTFLYREKLPVVPIHSREDRYAPYRVAFDRASVVAYVFDPRRSREDLDKELQELSSAPEFSSAERLEVGDLTALVLHRTPVAPAVSHSI
jgi:hypothetical protein